MDRYLLNSIKQDLDSKIILITGPRQCGKTTLSRLLAYEYDYLNYDLAEHRLLLAEKSWDRKKPLVIFDELHKMENWKSWLKGIYDVEGIPPSLVVTGSARMDAFRKVGDSLAGRHFTYRLHPLDYKEAIELTDLPAKTILERLLTIGGFPEPFLDGSDRFYNRWRRSNVNLVLREDLISLTAIRDIQSIETLVELLRSRVGSTVSTSSLARDLQKSHNTVANWLQLLADLYIIFRVTPFSKNIARSLQKEPKYYFYDTGMVKGDDGARLENLVACSLLKEVDRLADVEGHDMGIHFIRDKDGREVDFAITLDNEAINLIEVKTSDDSVSKHLRRFLPSSDLKRTQIVKNLDHARSFPDGLRVEPLTLFLSQMELI